VSRGAGSFNRFTFADIEKIEKEAVLIRGVSPIVRTGGQVIGGGNNWSTGIYGVSEDYFEIRNWELEYGEFFSDRDVKTSNKVALLGKTVANQLFIDFRATIPSLPRSPKFSESQRSQKAKCLESR